MRFHAVVLLIGAACLLVSPSAAQAQVINGSFESGNLVSGSNPEGAANADQLFPGETNITGWTIITSQIAWAQVPNQFNVTAGEGIRSLDLTGWQDAPPYGGVSQVIATDPGATYNLSFMIGVFGGNTAAIAASAGAASQTLSFTGNAGNTANQWGTVGFDFVATGPTTTISLSGASTTQAIFIGLDNVSVTLVAPAATVAPEPATASLLAIGLSPLLGAAAIRKRLRKV